MALAPETKQRLKDIAWKVAAGAIGGGVAAVGVATQDGTIDLSKINPALVVIGVAIYHAIVTPPAAATPAPAPAATPTRAL